MNTEALNTADPSPRSAFAARVVGVVSPQTPVMDDASVAAGEVQVPIRSSADIVTARQKGRALAALAGFSASNLTIIATAISEVARNIVEYAGKGDVTITLIGQGGRTGVRIVANDSGPGIPDVALVMRDGYSTGSGLGIGLPGARRLMDEFEIASAVGEGTTISMRKWL
jgi:serine/threonine-protein kinase RsbT